MSDFALIAGGMVSAFAIGFILGKWVKTVRQFFDAL